MKRIYQLAVLAVAASTLAACSGNNNSDAGAAPPTTVVTPPPQENAFGANFGTAFRAPETAAPVIPADADIVPLSLTTNPTPVG